MDGCIGEVIHFSSSLSPRFRRCIYSNSVFVLFGVSELEPGWWLAFLGSLTLFTHDKGNCSFFDVRIEDGGMEIATTFVDFGANCMA
jgi:hypothetical protein